MKDLENTTYILEIQLYRHRVRKLIGLSQSLYIEKILKGFNMLNFKKGLLSVRPIIHFSKGMSPNTHEERDCMSKIPHSLAIGSLMYAMIYIWFDIACTVSVVSRYQSNPGECH